MKRIVVVVDTNVVVAGLITGNGTSPVARILDEMLGAALVFAVSEALLAEYRSVLLRPNLRTMHGLNAGEIDLLLTNLAQHAIVVRPVAATPAPDPGDQLLWDLLAARPDLQLVTGDKRLLADAGMSGRVISPRQFVAASA